MILYNWENTWRRKQYQQTEPISCASKHLIQKTAASSSKARSHRSSRISIQISLHHKYKYPCFLQPLLLLIFWTSGPSSYRWRTLSHQETDLSVLQQEKYFYSSIIESMKGNGLEWSTIHRDEEREWSNTDFFSFFAGLLTVMQGREACNCIFYSCIERREACVEAYKNVIEAEERRAQCGGFLEL